MNFPIISLLKNYSYLGQLYQNRTFNGETDTYQIVPQPTSAEFRKKSAEFVDASLAVRNENIITYQEKAIKSIGMSVEASFPRMFSLDIWEGDPRSLEEINNVLISRSFSKALFGSSSAIGKIIKFDNTADLIVSGIYEDFPQNTEFKEVQILTTFDFFRSIDAQAKESENSWGSNDYLCYVQIGENILWEDVQSRYKNLLF